MTSIQCLAERGSSSGKKKMFIKEFRVVMPMTVEEYQIGQLFTVAEESKNHTGNGEGVEVVKNEPFEGTPHLSGGRFSQGQYTYKIYHLESKLPSFIRFFVPKGSLEIHEESWNAYPFCKTVLTIPGLKSMYFYILIETMHYADRGVTENIHEVPPEHLNAREVVMIDIANDPIQSTDYKPCEDPTKFRSEKTGRGPLVGKWQDTINPVMTCYKLVTADYKWYGFQKCVEGAIAKAEQRLFTNFNRRVFCLLDRWYGMTIEDIRRLEDETRGELERKRNQGAVRGKETNSD